MREVNERTVHPCTLTSHHAQNRILKHQPAGALLALLLSNPIALIINSTNVPSKATSSSKEHIRKRFAAACVMIGPAYDPKCPKSYCRWAVLSAKLRRDEPVAMGDGDVVCGEVRDEPCDAW